MHYLKLIFHQYTQQGPQRCIIVQLDYHQIIGNYILQIVIIQTVQ
jgi:hypothetical protein